MFSTTKEALEYIKKNEIPQLDVKVGDLQGRWRRMTYSAQHVTEELFEARGRRVGRVHLIGVEQGEDRALFPCLPAERLDELLGFPVCPVCSIEEVVEATSKTELSRHVATPGDRHRTPALTLKDLLDELHLLRDSVVVLMRIAAIKIN